MEAGLESSGYDHGVARILAAGAAAGYAFPRSVAEEFFAKAFSAYPLQGNVKL